MKTFSTVKFFYLHDQKDPQRVLTVARQVVKGKKHTRVHVGWALAHPTVKDEYGYVLVDGDQFTKSRGRQIAQGRMMKNPVKVELLGDETPLWASMRALAECEEVPRRVRKMAKSYVSNSLNQLTSQFKKDPAAQVESATNFSQQLVDRLMSDEEDSYSK